MGAARPGAIAGRCRLRSTRPIISATGRSNDGNHRPKPARRFFCDPWRILAALKRHCRLIFGVAGAAALGAGVFGYLQSSYNVRVTLIARETNPALAATPETEGYRPRQLTAATLVNLMQSPELLRRGAAKAQPPVSADSLQGRVAVEPVPNTDLVALTVTGKNRQSLVDLANLLANQAVALGRELQMAEAKPDEPVLP